MAKSSRKRRKSSSRSRRTKRVVKQDVPPVELTEEYHYVVEDLVRIGIIAAVLIGGLVALSLFL